MLENPGPRGLPGGYNLSCHRIRLEVNGEVQELEVRPYELLLNVLRDRLHLTGAKYGCGIGECGACTVLVDGKATLACLVLAVSVNGCAITTVEGMGNPRCLHPLQQSFLDHDAVQCGFCTPGMLLAAKALLDENPAPSEDEVRQYLRGNLCRCTGHAPIVEAVLEAAPRMSRESGKDCPGT